MQEVVGCALPGLGGGWTLLRRGTWDFGEPEALPGAFGRGGILKAGEVVLRPYRRGGWVRFVNDRVYAHPRRFLQEFRVHAALWEGGFPTVEPLGVAWRPCRWGAEGVFLTRYTEAVPWPRVWDRSALVVPQVRRMLEALVSAGLWAPDLNATNILVKPDGQALALDWDRAVLSTADDLMERYRRRLERSLEKLGAPEEVWRSWKTPG